MDKVLRKQMLQARLKRLQAREKDNKNVIRKVERQIARL